MYSQLLKKLGNNQVKDSKKDIKYSEEGEAFLEELEKAEELEKQEIGQKEQNSNPQANSQSIDTQDNNTINEGNNENNNDNDEEDNTALAIKMIKESDKIYKEYMKTRVLPEPKEGFTEEEAKWQSSSLLEQLEKDPERKKNFLASAYCIGKWRNYNNEEDLKHYPNYEKIYELIKGFLPPPNTEGLVRPSCYNYGFGKEGYLLVRKYDNEPQTVEEFNYDIESMRSKWSN